MTGRVLLVLMLVVSFAAPAYAEEAPSFVRSLFVSWFPLVLFLGLWLFFMRRMGAGKQRELVEMQFHVMSKFPEHMLAPL